MSADVVADTALWVLSAVAVVFVAFGCWMTKPKQKAVQQDSGENVLDRAA